MDRDPTYHARRANAELLLCLSANDRCAAEAHRTLTMLHVGKLMASQDSGLRSQAVEIIARLHGREGILTAEFFPEDAGDLPLEQVAEDRLSARPKSRAH